MTDENKSQPETREKSFLLHSLAELVALPKPGFLIESVLPTNGISVMYGAPASGKSFIGLDWSLCVATGQAWAGLTVAKGDVLYVAAEGAPGFGPRVTAWLDAHGIEDPSDIPGIHFVTEPVHLGHRNDETGSLLNVLEARAVTPSLIVIDTLSRCLAGVDENSTMAMSAMVDNGEMLARRLNAAILLIHHTRRRDLEIRGSGALSGAANMMASVEKLSTTNRVLMECTKMKDAVEFEPMKFTFRTAGSPDNLSCVLELDERLRDLSSSKTDDEMGEDLGQMTPSVRRCYLALPDGGASKSEWGSLVVGPPDQQRVSRSTFYKAITYLTKHDYITVDPDPSGDSQRDVFRRMDEMATEDPPFVDPRDEGRYDWGSIDRRKPRSFMSPVSASHTL